MNIHSESHTDHLPPNVIDHLLSAFAGRRDRFVETVELPVHLPAVKCSLYGPAAGDPPVPESEVVYRRRPGRLYLSRLVDRPAKVTRTVTVIAGPHGGEPCVLYTAYGGPPAPREPPDPALAALDDLAAERESDAFWKVHALSLHG